MEPIKIEIKLDLPQSELLSQELERRHLKIIQKNSMKLSLKFISNK